MILSVMGPCDHQEFSAVVATRLLSNSTARSRDGYQESFELAAETEVEICLENLYFLQEHPEKSRQLQQIDSVANLISELQAFNWYCFHVANERALLVDLTPQHHGRDVSGLLRANEAVPAVSIVSSTCPGSADPSTKFDIESGVQLLLSDLIHGVSCFTLKGEEVKVKAGVITVCIGFDFEEGSTTSNCGLRKERCSDLEKLMLESCRIAQQRVMLDMKTTAAPPLFIQLQQNGEEMIRGVLGLVQEIGINLSDVAICRNAISSSNVCVFEDIMRQYEKFFLVVDCFGVTEKTKASQQGLISDNDSCEAIKTLIERGFADRLIITANVTSKLNLLRFGGAGYIHVQRSIVPRLHECGVDRHHIEKITISNLAAFVAKYSPPPKIETPKDTFSCHICHKVAEFGDHYSKFNFLYCSSKCLRKHGKENWK